jgi:WhiB family redox-sensing transcriptional regulator
MTAAWEWQVRAACRGLDSMIFFHPEGERGPAKERRDAHAKLICRQCPVIAQCGEHALATREPYGVWGGLSKADRDLIIELDALPHNRPDGHHLRRSHR